MTDEETITIEGYEVEDWTTASKRMFNHGHDGVYLPTSMIDEGRITIQDNGDVTMPLWLAESEGLVSGGTRVGIPLKRQRLPDMPEQTVSDESLLFAARQMGEFSALVWHAVDDNVLCEDGRVVAVCESKEMAAIVAMTPRTVTALISDLTTLRAWAAEAQKRAERKGTRRG